LHVWTHAALAACLLAVACFACGGGAGGAPPPQLAPGASGEPAASAGPEGAPTAPAGSASASTPLGAAPIAVEMKSPVPTAMADDLKALGLDLKNLPPIEKLEPRALRGVMKLMAKSLGVKCGDCHQEGDFAAPTRRKKIAAHMWDEFAAKLLVAEGPAPVFCDSCHQGRTVLLDRRDKKALAKWMDDNFVAKLQRKDGKSEECESCHVDMDMHFLAQWGR
jgi:hypothetical protein